MTGTVEYTAGGETVQVPIGNHTFANGSIGQSAVLRGGFTLDAATDVTVRISGTGGTEAPALSWIGISDHTETADRTELAAALAEATTAPRQAYTPETWQALRDQGLAAKAVHDDPTATQEQVDAATAALRATIDALVEVAYLALPDYRVAVVAGEELDLPDTVELATRSGATQEVPVQWQETPTAETPYAVVPVAGRAGQTGQTPVTLQLEVVPDGVVAFVDAASTQGAADPEAPGASPAFDAVAELRGDALIGDVPDQVFDDETGWGLRNPIGSGESYVGLRARGTGVYDKSRTTGWWASSGGSVDYGFTLPAGSYELTSGYQEWWSVTRQVAPSVEIGGERISGDRVNLSGSTPRAPRRSRSRSTRRPSSTSGPRAAPGPRTPCSAGSPSPMSRRPAHPPASRPRRRRRRPRRCRGRHRRVPVPGTTVSVSSWATRPSRCARWHRMSPPAR